MSATPLQRLSKIQITRSVSWHVTAWVGAPDSGADSNFRNNPSSTEASSARSVFSISLTADRTCVSLSDMIHIKACASLGIAFLRDPPVSAMRPRALSFFMRARARAIALLALPRCLWMSIPECPPFKPPTVSLNIRASAGTGSIRTLREIVVSTPPAQPMVNTPSSSESRLIRVRPFTKPGFNAFAPLSPVSSSTVKSSSSGGWVIVVASASASI